MNQIEQSAGRCHQHFGTAGEGTDLPVDRYASDGQRDLERTNVPAISAEAIGDLAGQFTRGRKHQHAAGFLRGTLTLFEEVIQDRQREGCGLAGSSLCDANDIAALGGNRNGLMLDRSGSDIFLFGEGAKDRLCEAELVK